MKLKEFIKTTISEFLNEQQILKEYNSNDLFLSSYDTAMKYAYDNIDDVAEVFDAYGENPEDMHTSYSRDKYIELIELYVDKYNELKTQDLVTIFRLIKLNSINDLDINNIGKHWSDEYSYKEWLLELGVDEDVLYNATFYDKGYAFFRYCMDNSIDEDNIVDLVKYMVKHNITDSRDIDDEMWNNYMIETNHTQQDVRDLLENAGDMISIPDLMDFLDNYSNIILTGGGINECLKEVEIALLSLDRDYYTLSEFVY